jgi:LSD1 subclass zinc finger protein
MTQHWNTPIFRCPSCRTPLHTLDPGAQTICPECDFSIPSIDGVPLLVKDLAVIERTIEGAKRASRQDWFQAPQMGQWSGPYRHHVLKRKQYVEGVLADYVAGRQGDIVGLDLGCGDGANIDWLSHHLTALYASDYNLTRLQRAKQVGEAEMVYMADITDYPAVDSSFDVVYFNHVLEHIPDDSQALSEVNRILKPGGRVVLGVPNEGAMFWQLAYRLQPSSRATTDHLHFYTADAVRTKCQTAGFEVLETLPIGWGLPHWSLDAAIRGAKFVDDLLDKIGKALIPSQSTSLYLILTK